MTSYTVVLTGTAPLFMRADNQQVNSQITAWRKDPTNHAPKGDGRYPGWAWLADINFHDDGVCLLAHQLWRALREAAKCFTAAKDLKLAKSLMAKIVFASDGFPLLIGEDRQVLTQEVVQTLAYSGSLSSQHNKAEALGFVIDVRRAKVGSLRLIRCMPQFPRWACEVVFHSDIDEGTLSDLFSYCGEFGGQGSWRPSSAIPGPYGTFTAHVGRS